MTHNNMHEGGVVLCVSFLFIFGLYKTTNNHFFWFFFGLPG